MHSFKVWFVYARHTAYASHYSAGCGTGRAEARIDMFVTASLAGLTGKCFHTAAGIDNKRSFLGWCAYEYVDVVVADAHIPVDWHSMHTQ